MSTESMEILKITNPPTYGVIVEKEFGQSLFNEVYKGAANNVADIISRNKDQDTGEKNINTTIAFVGSRGTGKSSAMHSFADFLKNSNQENAFDWLNDGHEETAKKNKQGSLPPPLRNRFITIER